MQSASDVFPGWRTGKAGRHFYVRQLRDMRLKPMVEQFSSTDMIRVRRMVRLDAGVCSRPQRRTGGVGGYMSRTDTFDKAIAAFSIAYADETGRDYELLKQAARKRELEVVMER